MTVPWIESHWTLPDHPKTQRFATLLGVSIPTAIGYLHMLWYFCLKYAPDGVLDEFDNDEIAGACRYPSEGDEFVLALFKSGWLDRDGDEVLSIHNWSKYTGRILVKNKKHADRQRRYRASVAEKLVALREVQQQNTVADVAPPPVEAAPPVEVPPVVKPTKAIAALLRHEDPDDPPGQGASGKRKTGAPDKMTITPRMRMWAKERAPLCEDDLEEVTENFLNYHGSKGTLFIDWTRAWYTWVGNQQRYRVERSARFGGNGQAQTRVEAIRTEAQGALDIIASLKQQAHGRQ